MKCWTTKSGCSIRKILDGRCNCFLISEKGRHLLVDAGGKNNRIKLLSRLEELGVRSDSLQALILTHSHFDHAENAAHIRQAFQTKIILQKSEADFLQKGENPPLHGTFFFMGLITDKSSNAYLSRFFKYPPAQADILVDDRFDLSPLGFNGCIIHTPGHSPGSASVIIDDEIALAGDTLFGVFPQSAFPPFAADEKRMVQSWERLLDTRCTVFLPAHGFERSRDLLQGQYHKYKKRFHL